VGRLDSKRIFRFLGPQKAQLEVGREGDVDRLTHLAWRNALDVQRILASSVGTTATVQAKTLDEEGYALRLIVEQKGTDGVTRYPEIGELSEFFRGDLGNLWSRIDSDGKFRPAPNIPHLYLVAVTTVGLSEQQRGAVRPPFSQSGLALAPVIKGFPTIQFLYRKGGRNRQ
jgi:hypothetical protein